MSNHSGQDQGSEMNAAKYPWLPYVAPFAAFIASLALERFVPAVIEVLYPIRVIMVLAVILVFSRSVLDFDVKNTLGSLALGVAAFFLLGGPDRPGPPAPYPLCFSSHRNPG